MSPVEIFSGKFFRAASCYLGYLRYFALAAGSIMRLNFADKCPLQWLLSLGIYFEVFTVKAAHFKILDPRKKIDVAFPISKKTFRGIKSLNDLLPLKSQRRMGEIIKICGRPWMRSGAVRNLPGLVGPGKVYYLRIVNSLAYLFPGVNAPAEGFPEYGRYGVPFRRQARGPGAKYDIEGVLVEVLKLVGEPYRRIVEFRGYPVGAHFLDIHKHYA